MSTKKRSTRAFGFSRRFLIHLGVFFVVNLALAIWVRTTDENPNWLPDHLHLAYGHHCPRCRRLRVQQAGCVGRRVKRPSRVVDLVSFQFESRLRR